MSVPSPTAPNNALFKTVHKLLSDDPAAQSQENRRNSNRRPFHRPQLIAAYDGQRPPDASEFRLLECEDLSERGFSYYEATPPTYRRLVVALGAAPFRFLTGEVAHFKPVKRPDGKSYLVGCRFTGRLAEDAKEANEQPGPG